MIVADDGFDEVAQDKCTECMDEGECDGKRQCKWAPQDKCGYELKKKPKPKRDGLLFADEGEAEVGETQSLFDTPVKLSSLLVVVAAVVVLFVVSRWWRTSKTNGYEYSKLSGSAYEDDWQTQQTVY